MTTLLVLIAAIALGALDGCNTIEDVGQDVTATGRVVAKAADDAKPNQSHALSGVALTFRGG
jgi:predicted small secreted protein